MLFDRTQVSDEYIVRAIHHIESNGRSATISLISETMDVNYSRVYAKIYQMNKEGLIVSKGDKVKEPRKKNT
jgi:Mn-dependent DtxR family transcriptional regulator